MYVIPDEEVKYFAIGDAQSFFCWHFKTNLLNKACLISCEYVKMFPPSEEFDFGLEHIPALYLGTIYNLPLSDILWLFNSNMADVQYVTLRSMVCSLVFMLLLITVVGMVLGLGCTADSQIIKS